MPFNFNLTFADFEDKNPISETAKANSDPVAANNIYKNIAVDDGPVELDVLANDSDADDDDLEIVESSLTQPSNGSVSTDGSTVTFTPTSPEEGSFSYGISDGKSGFDSGVVTTEVGGGGVEPEPEPEPSGSIVVEVGTEADPYAGTDADDVFEFDVVDARGTADNTQHEITGFDAAADSLEFNLADDVAGDYTLDELNGIDSVAVEGNPFEGSTLITFGPDDNGDVISLELAGVTDASQVDVAVI